jgi:hypothetical protein
MPYANRSAFIIGTVRDILDGDTDISVVKVWKAEFGSTIIAYPHIMTQSFTETLEDGYNSGLGEATVNILIHDKVAGDTQATGVATDQYGAIVQKVEELFENATLPVNDTHSGGLFKTTIHDIRVTSWDGMFDNAAGKLMTACSLKVDFTHTKV